MNPNPEPTLAMLRIDLERTSSAFDTAAGALKARPSDPACQDEVAHAAIEAFEIVAKVTRLRATSIPDLSVKAKALAHLFAAVPESRPVGWEQQRLCQQIIEGLLDEELA